MHKYQTYWDLVKAALWQQPATWPVEQTEELLRLNAMQGTGALVFPSALAQDGLSSYARAQMKSVCMSTMQQHVKLHHTLSMAWTALEKAGINVVLMKGATLAALYPSPEQRAWGDIDLFVGKEQYHPACAVMRDTFPGALKFDEELDHYKHYNIITDGISIETHRVTMGLQHPLDVKRYAQMEAYGVAHASDLKIGDLNVKVFEPTFNALFVMFHCWEHMLTLGANVRQLCDLTLLLHRYAAQIDRPRLRKYLNALHLMDVWQLLMYMCVNGLGLAIEEAPFYTTKVAQRAEHLMNDLLEGKLKEPKHEEQAPKARFVRKFHTMLQRFEGARRILQYSSTYARHMDATTLLNGASRLFAKDRHWE